MDMVNNFIAFCFRFGAVKAERGDDASEFRFEVGVDHHECFADRVSPGVGKREDRFDTGRAACEK